MAGLTGPITDAAEARARCEALARAGEALVARPVADVIEVLASAVSRWADADYAPRRDAERALSAHHGVPSEAIARVLDAGFGAWSREALLGRVNVELGDARALDGFVEMGGAFRTALGPRLAVALASRGVPTTPVGELIDLLSVKSPVWLKPAAGADDLALRFAATVREIDPGIGAAIQVAGWPRGSAAGAVALAAADLVVATGRAETLAELGRQVRESTRLVLHGPRLSAAILTREALAGDPAACVAALADDVAFAGQVGCLSPVVAWVEGAGAGESGEALARAVHGACEERWPARPRTEADAAERAAWAEWSARARVKRAGGAGGGVVGGAQSGWSVAWWPEPAPPSPPPAPRILYLSAVESADVAVRLCASARGMLSSVGIAGPPARVRDCSALLARAGVERIAPLGRMQRPPADWRRDGRATIADLVRWVDREG
ncbi:MAG TPA: acyl-CoA reductase [Gemmatimonadota bacterium]|nr:acyl-CoA reductase [Gemmatimonadota bacterium]